VGADYSTEDLRQRLPRVTIVDTLGPSYFCNGHIPGAVNIPPHRVAELAPSLLPDQSAPVVVYGAHRYSAGADAVVRQLTLLGYRDVSRYADGKEAWVQAGLPLAADSEP
jgi:rhodanese-related sulfurtransferase